MVASMLGHLQEAAVQISSHSSCLQNLKSKYILDQATLMDQSRGSLLGDMQTFMPSESWMNFWHGILQSIYTSHGPTSQGKNIVVNAAKHSLENLEGGIITLIYRKE
ncbi:hypothetical protein GUJ93_ZPchr0011g28249 [Zizania palustris]|uniref:Uncharacterized protein n=1 Tax=Zizania palustris TaxID=103762 RepID=A0A8J5WJY3_ZIZPA|nr:hypothetical protein GUJ93_ZPchr0011g28249 [Zizania palustris]